MPWSNRLTALALLVVATAVLASRVLDSQPAPLPVIATPNSPAPSSACVSTPPLRFDGSEVADLTTLRLDSNDGVRLHVCRPSTVALQADGTAVNGVGARLTVAVGGETLWDGVIDGATDVDVTVPHAGWIVLAFTNDLHRPPQDRNLVIRDLSVRGLTDPDGATRPAKAP